MLGPSASFLHLQIQRPVGKQDALERVRQQHCFADILALWTSQRSFEEKEGELYLILHRKLVHPQASLWKEKDALEMYLYR